jgi:hypothetical protein
MALKDIYQGNSAAFEVRVVEKVRTQVDNVWVEELVPVDITDKDVVLTISKVDQQATPDFEVTNQVHDDAENGITNFVLTKDDVVDNLPVGDYHLDVTLIYGDLTRITISKDTIRVLVSTRLNT